jgi:hypothetical protein
MIPIDKKQNDPPPSGLFFSSRDQQEPAQGKELAAVFGWHSQSPWVKGANFDVINWRSIERLFGVRRPLVFGKVTYTKEMMALTKWCSCRLNCESEKKEWIRQLINRNFVIHSVTVREKWRGGFYTRDYEFIAVVTGQVKIIDWVFTGQREIIKPGEARHDYKIRYQTDGHDHRQAVPQKIPVVLRPQRPGKQRR